MAVKFHNAYDYTIEQHPDETQDWQVSSDVVFTLPYLRSMQFGFMPGKGTTNATFVVRQVQERFMDKKRPLFFAFCQSQESI